MSNSYPHKIFLSLLLVISCLLNVSAASESQQKVVKIGYFSSHSFQIGEDDNSPKSGYAYQFMTSLSNFTNWKYQYIYGSFAELYPKLLSGEIDAMSGISKSPDREANLLFPEEAMGAKTYYIYTNDDNPNVTTDRKTLIGKKIGVVGERIMDLELQRWVKEHHLDINIVKYADFKELYQALIDGELDGIVAYADDTSVLKNVKPVVRMGEVPFYMVFSKQRTDLVEEFDKAFNIINELDPHFIANLQNAYSNLNIINTTLSQTEQQWLTNHPNITVGYLDNYLPFSNTNDYGQVTGLITNVMDEICKKLSLTGKMKVKYQGYSSYDDLLKALKRGDIEMIFPVGGSSWNAEQEGIFVSLPVVSTSMALVFKYKVDENTDKRIAVNRNNTLQLHYTKNHYPEAEIVFYENIEDCLQAVMDGRANSTIVNGIRVNSILTKYRKGLSYISLSDEDKRCFGVNAGNDSLMILLNRGLKLIGKDYGASASHMYIKADYTTFDFIRDHAVAAIACIVLLFVIVLWFIRQGQLKKERFMRELEQRNSELEKAQAEAEYANSSKTKFLNSMSHDIRTPMNAIMGFTNLAQQNITDQKRLGSYLQKISLSSRHLLSLINEILDMSRIESGKIQLKETQISLSILLDNMRIITEESAKEKNITMEFHKENIQNDSIYADQLRLSQILINIIGNAIKYTEQDGTVTISIEQTGNITNGHCTYVFRVKDNGIGMSEDFRQHIFEAFTREHTTTISQIQGTGLGMAITKSLVDMMQGTIDVKSTLGEGSEFIITIAFPVALYPLYHYDEKDAVVSANISFHGKRVLLVEDNELNQEIAYTLLDSLGLEVEVAENGKVAVEAIESHEAGYYDVVLMDVQMPVMDGYEASRTIRKLQHESKRNVPIVATTANAFDEDKRLAFDAGMNAHITKPIEPAKLTEALQWILSNHK